MCQGVLRPSSRSETFFKQPWEMFHRKKYFGGSWKIQEKTPIMASRIQVKRVFSTLLKKDVEGVSSKEHAEPWQTSKMMPFAKVVNGIVKRTIFVVWKGFEYASVSCKCYEVLGSIFLYLNLRMISSDIQMIGS